MGGIVDSFDADDDAAERLLRGVVGGVAADADSAGFRCFDGDGVFSTSTSLSDDELLEDDVESTLSRDFGAADCWLDFFDGRPGRLLLAPTLPPADVSLVLLLLLLLLLLMLLMLLLLLPAVSFFGRPRPRRLGASAPVEDAAEMGG